MRAELQITHRVEAVPVALLVQSLNVLAQNAETLRETIDAFVVSNPLVEFTSCPSYAEEFDISQVADPVRTTLAEHLMMQLRVVCRDQELLRIGSFIINSLDRNGYLTDSTEELTRTACTTPSRFQEALSLVQSLEPCGVGARSLSECLRIQLEAQPVPCPLAIRIVTHHLEEFAAGTLQLDGYSKEEIDEAGRLIRSLQPRPGLQYDNSAVNYIIPDIKIEEEQGKLKVSLINQPAVPSLCPQYMEYLKTENEEQRQYVQDNLLYARSFIYAIRERMNTVLLVAEHAVSRQSDYILTGTVSALRPMTLTSLALETNLSLSTVSRTVANKYMEFRGRVFPFRTLFTSGGNTEHSRDEIVHRIKELIESTPDGHILSDAAIAKILSAEGIHISRRTVNKYRNNYLKSREEHSVVRRRTV